MTDLTKLTITEALKGLKEKKFSAVELTKEYLNKMESSRELNAYVLETPEKALEQAKAADEKYKNGTNGALEGIPLGIKDLFCTRGIRTTACSHILDGFVPPYESTVTQKLLDAGAVFLGKLNMDEFAMGGSNETSFYGPAVNPWSKDKSWWQAVLRAVRPLPWLQISARRQPVRIPAVPSASRQLSAALPALSRLTAAVRVTVLSPLPRLWTRPGRLPKTCVTVPLC